MVSKIHKSSKNQFGITYIEVLIVVGIILVLTSTIYLFINPLTIKKRGRDEKRLSDLTVLDRAISEFVLDNGVYPDDVNTTRTSTTLPQGSSGPLSISNGQGWIKENLTKYTVKLPLDPINDTTYKYTYRHTANGYELNAVLEYNTEFAQEDGGNDSAVYEIGNDLTIL